ncbi:hotdog fold thioesterase [Streptantibioticus ferralitis]|uniref:Hotdog fold thioesterase n=2 Tax=Streptantibioticus ferralitis TaxID=236510 RepID=A0ABT5YSA0_9ACTN|nr:hotdog fold thioesterase [Streptantibioticus ferralitis]
MPKMMLGPMQVDRSFESEQLTRRLGIEIITCEKGLVVGTMPISGNRQPVGILHGGANAVLAETLGSVAAFLYASPGGNAVGIDLSCTHHRWVSSGTVTGVCRPLDERQSVASYEIVVTDDSGNRTCTARLTCAIRRGGGRRRGLRNAPGQRTEPDDIRRTEHR